jgi:hypothetical protein
MRKHLLAITVILTVASGCDNVAFGGIDFELKPPPVSGTEPTAEASADQQGTPENVAGPILLAGVRDGLRGDFVVVGEVLPGELQPFPHPDFEDDLDRLGELTAAGSEWTLFAEGVRVGRLIVDESSPATGYCGSKTTVSGVVELISGAASAEKFLALPSSDASAWPYGDYEAIAHDYYHRVSTLTIAAATIREEGATLPPLGVLEARDDVRAFQLRDVPGEAVAATFMHADELAVGSPGQGAYSLFVIAQGRDTTYVETYSWYRSVEAEGKGAPRYFDHLDWDGDGTDEVLLEVLGSDRRWFAALSQNDGSWARTFQDSCGSGSNSGR